MKTRMILLLIFCLLFILGGCAANPPKRNMQNNEEEYETGLKYSTWLYSQPIDILKDEFDVLENVVQNNALETLENKKRLLSDFSGKYSVQIGSFKNKENAGQYLQTVSTRYSTFVLRLHYSGKLWKVLAGEVTERNDAEQLLQRLKKDGFSDAWIVQF